MNVGTPGTFDFRTLKAGYNTFTGYHRCYVHDELFNDENIDIFKNNYIGRIVISTRKIKTDSSRKIESETDEYEWYSRIDKDRITIEDALPIIKLSRVK